MHAYPRHIYKAIRKLRDLGYNNKTIIELIQSLYGISIRRAKMKRIIEAQITNERKTIPHIKSIRNNLTDDEIKYMSKHGEGIDGYWRMNI